jgi:hypothetical protein
MGHEVIKVAYDVKVPPALILSRRVPPDHSGTTKSKALRTVSEVSSVIPDVLMAQKRKCGAVAVPYRNYVIKIQIKQRSLDMR